jgi:hypothetical protein
MRGLGVLNREQYEVNPEEITVAFDDVRGVSLATSSALVKGAVSFQFKVPICDLLSFNIG